MKKQYLGALKSLMEQSQRRLASVKPTSNMCASFLCRNENISSATNDTKLNFSALHFSLAHRVLNICMCNTQIYRQDWFHPTISFRLLQREISLMIGRLWFHRIQDSFFNLTNLNSKIWRGNEVLLESLTTTFSWHKTNMNFGTIKNWKLCTFLAFFRYFYWIVWTFYIWNPIHLLPAIEFISTIILRNFVADISLRKLIRNNQ